MKVNISKFYNSGQKVNIEINRYDTYNADSTLGLIILPILVQLKNTKHGVPSEFVDVGGEDYSPQDSFDFYKESHNDAFNEAVKKWDEVLDKMIWSFQQIVDDNYSSKYHHGNFDFDWDKITDEKFYNPITKQHEELTKLVDKNPNGHWYDHEGEKIHNERIQEGLELFGEHFRSLWD